MSDFNGKILEISMLGGVNYFHKYIKYKNKLMNLRNRIHKISI
jgi:hypothetical protein